MLQLFLRARLDFGTAGVGAASIPACAFHTIIAVEVEIILQNLTITLTGNGSEEFVAMMDDLSAEVAVIDARGVATVCLLYLAHQSTDLTVCFHGDVAIAVFYAVVVVGHIAADGAKLVVTIFILSHASSYHGTMFDGAAIVHSAAYSSYVTVVTIAATDVHIHQFEVLDSAVVHLAEESTIVVISFNFQVSDDVPLAVECSAKLVAVVPSDGMVIEVDLVHIKVGPQLDGPSFITLVAIVIIIPQLMQCGKVGRTINKDSLIAFLQTTRYRAVPGFGLGLCHSASGCHSHQHGC